MSSSEEEITLTPNTLMERNAKKVVEQILPPKSKQNFLTTYENFMRWRAENLVNCFAESVFLTYFDELSKKLKPSTLWSVYSMLKSTLQMKNDVHIKTYVKLTCYLQRLSTGHKSVKSKVFTAKQIETFLNTAPDTRYLATKIKFDLNISGPVASSEKKKNVAMFMVLLWMIFTVLMQYYDSYIFAEKDKEDNVLLLMLVYYNIPRYLADTQGVIVILRWAWTVLAVHDVNTTLNEHMQWLLTGSDFMSLPSQSEKLIRRLVFSHEQISEIMIEMNDTNGVMLMVIFMSKFLRIILAPYYMFVQKELFAVPLYLNWLLVHLVVLMLTIEPCHWTHTQREDTINQLGQLILHLAPKSKGISYELDQFAKQVVLNNVKFETLGVYTLDRQLTSMILGGVTTYVVILIQFQMLSP